jgi:hypothetical protein
MGRRKRTGFRRRIVWLAVFVVALTVGSYAFTASLTVPSSAAGEGSGTVNGYTVGTPTYTLNAADPTKVDQVVIHVSATVTASTAVTVSANAGVNWQTCTQGAISSGAADYTCVFATKPTTAAVTNLQVAIAN